MILDKDQRMIDQGSEDLRSRIKGSYIKDQQVLKIQVQRILYQDQRILNQETKEVCDLRMLDPESNIVDPG